MFGGIGKILDKAKDIVTNPTGAALDLAKDSFGKIVEGALKDVAGGLFGGNKSLGDLMAKLRGSALGSGLAFDGLSGGKPSRLSLEGSSLGLPPGLESIQPAVDGIAHLIAGDGEVAPLLSDLIGGAIAGSANPAEALANLEKLAEQLGIDGSAVSQMLQAMKQAGLIPDAQGTPSPMPGGGAPAAAGAPAAGGASGPKTPLGGTVDGTGGFLYKPTSDSDGNLVVLTPERMAGNVASVVVRGPDGSVLATGRPAGNGNGGRDHFRFDKPGSSLPPNVTIEVKLRDGTTSSYPIGNPSLRYD